MDRLLEEKDVETNALGKCGKYDSPSTSLHHLARRRYTNVLGRFLTRIFALALKLLFVWLYSMKCLYTFVA